MKLRNKKTGEIIKLAPLRGIELWEADFPEVHDVGSYDSIAELNEDWEDYEEPKVGYIIDPMEEDYISADDSGYEWADIERAKEIGLWFETEEKAELAVRKLKAWKRLKDKGFRFIGKTYETDKRFGSLFYKVDEDTYSEDIIQELDICFGGKE